MSKIKSRRNNNKISKKEIDKNKCRNNIAFSFNHVTKNKSFNLNRFEKDNPQKYLECIKALTARMLEMTNQGWTNLFLLDKTKGLETIDMKLLRFAPYNLDVDVKKFISIRFSSGKYRLIGNKREGCGIFDIWGIDYDFSAYKH